MSVQFAPTTSLERRYFIGSALVLLALTFAGFAKTYYLRQLFESTSLSNFLHIHGAVMTAWLALFFVQVLLIAFGKRVWHRRLGVFGIAVAGLVVLLGCMATLRAAAREVAAHSAQASSQVTVLGLELTQMFLFSILVVAGIGLRHRVDYHKRLMLLATLCMLPNPISRLPIAFQSNLIILLIFDAIVIAAIVADAVRTRRLHPAFFVAGVLVLIVLHAAFAFAYSSIWHTLATSMVS